MQGRPSWVLRPAVWFAAASMLTTCLHELTHACVAYALGVQSTLLNYMVDLDLTEAQAAGSQRAIIGIAGPLFCLVIGLAAWIAYRRARDTAASLPLLYFAVFGIATFFGNLMSASFIGDFSFAAVAMGLPMSVRHALSLCGVVGVAAVHFRAGKELMRFAPAASSRLAAVVGMIALPAVVGTAAVIAVNQPMPPSFAVVRLVEAAFWVFAALGAIVSERRSASALEDLRVRWVDGTAAVVAVVIVRVLVRGVPFNP